MSKEIEQIQSGHYVKNLRIIKVFRSKAKMRQKNK